MTTADLADSDRPGRGPVAPKHAAGNAGEPPPPLPHDEARGSHLFDTFDGLFGRFFRLFGSAALVSAALMFAGFLSDFGAYRLAGLPRLNMTVTSLVEQGADTVIDSIALLGAGGRGWVLGLALAAVVLAWGWRDSRWLQPWSRSAAVYRSLRIALLLLSVLLTGALFERAQRSLNGDQHGPQAVDAALRSVYVDQSFPSTHAREMAIQEQTYGVWGLGPVNWLARVAAQRDAGPDQTSGIPLRPIAEARTAARHVYGWLALLALLLTASLVLLLWWGRTLNQTDEQAGLPELHSGDLPASAPALLRGLAWCVGRLGAGVGLPIERLLAPLSLLLAVVCLSLLPLAHGLLARPSLGAETVMVYLDPGPTEVKTAREVSAAKTDGQTPTVVMKNEKNEQDLPDSAEPGPAARLDCAPDMVARLDEPLTRYRKARRKLLQERPTSDTFDGGMEAFSQSTRALAKAVIEQNCAEAVSVFWAARPSDGTRAHHPELAETYFRSFRAVQAAYGVRVGTLLGYPRDGQGLTLADAIVPLPLPRGGRSSVVDIARDQVQESVVIPDLDGRDLEAFKRHLLVDPDKVSTAERLVLADNATGLGFVADMLKAQRMHASAAGVTVTTLGTMALPAAYNNPKAADKAVQLLFELARGGATPWWPGKTDEIRGTAISSFHLARLPYAAHRFIGLMRDEPVPKAGCAGAGSPTPAACLSTVPTAAGYLLQDLVNEMQYFVGVADELAPPSLRQDRDDLVRLLVDIGLQPGVRDEVRGSACSALTLGGKFKAQAEVAQRFSRHVLSQQADTFPLSANGCVQALTVLGLADAQLRPALRSMVRGQVSSNNPALAGRLRATALVALADLDVAQEHELLFELYLEQAPAAAGGNPVIARLGEVLNELLDDVAPEPMAQRLWQCAADTARPDPVRNHCLAGFALLDEDYDGDDGHAGAIYDLLANARAPAGDGACAAFRHLKEMGSSQLRRVGKTDPVMQRCADARRS